MDVDNTTPPKARLRWYQFSLRSMLIGVAVLALFLGLVRYYWVHLVWVYCSFNDQFANVQAVPVGAMPDAPIPDEWSRCRFGSLEFALPAEMARNVIEPETNVSFLGFHDGSRRVIIGLPEDQTDLLEFQKTDLAIPPEGEDLSLPRLRLACYQASADDFRWSMTREEARWHTWRVVTGSLLRLGAKARIETLFRDDLEVVLTIDEKRASLDWQDTQSKAGNYIHFMDCADKIDLDWVRVFCQSLRFTGETYPNSMPPEKRRSLFEVLPE